MASTFTTLLRLNKPALGDAGWGTAVNGGFTDLADSAIAGTTTLSTDADVTLTTANGAADQSRQMILNCTGSRAAQRTITAPATSKVYVVINGTSGGYGVKIVGVGPTTGVVVPAGRMAVVAWNGSDFVTLGAVVDLHVAGQTRIQDSASASNYILIGSGTNAPRGGNSVTAQTGSMVMGTEAASSLFFVTNAATAMTLDASGNLGLGVTPSAWVAGSRALQLGSAGYTALYQGSGGESNFTNNVYLSAVGTWTAIASLGASHYQLDFGAHKWWVASSGTAGNPISFTQAMTLDASGNLGLGVTPSAWQSAYEALEVGNSLGIIGGSNAADLLYNAFINSSGNPIYRATDTASYYSLAQGKHRWGVAPSGTAGNPITFTQAMTLDASGNLAVGTSTTTNAKIFSYVNDAALPSMGARQDGAGPIQIWQSGGAIERARITSGGDFGINGTPPADSQFYSKNSGSGRFAATFENHDANGYGISVGSASTSLVYFYPNASRTGSPVGSITTNGSSTSFNNSSDRRLKENVTPAADAGALLDAVQIVEFDWKVGGHTRFGVIAQDLNAVAPEAVSAGDDGDEIEKTWGVDYSKLVPMLIKEVQSLRARVAALEAK